ncbi:MAG: hypothetical protein WKH97_10125 [Casimicrobiaceae bacterium]
MELERGVEAIGARLDPRITYPCYKSFDELIDVERLRSLDEYIAGRVRLHARKDQHDYFLNEHRLDTGSPHKPGVREIWLSRTKPGVPYDYFDLDKPELWQRTEAAEEFALLMDFIETLPFKVIGRMLIIYDDAGNAVPAHRDHLNFEICHNFVWFRTSLRKPFYVLNNETNEKRYVKSYSAWFDTVKQFHGTDISPGLSFSVRVDGVFTDELHKQIPVLRWNNACRPALWSCTSAPS